MGYTYLQFVGLTVLTFHYEPIIIFLYIFSFSTTNLGNEKWKIMDKEKRIKVICDCVKISKCQLSSGILLVCVDISEEINKAKYFLKLLQ